MFSRPLSQDIVDLFRLEALVDPPDDSPKCPQMMASDNPRHHVGAVSRCRYPKTRKELGYDSGMLCTLRGGRCPVQATMQEETGEEHPVALPRSRKQRGSAQFTA